MSTSARNAAYPPTLAVAALLLALLTFGVAARVAWTGVCATLATVVVASFAGVQMLRSAFPSEPSKLCSLIFGSILGLTLGRLSLVIVGLAYGTGTNGVLLGALILLVGGAALRGQRANRSEVATPQDRSDLTWLLALVTADLLLLSLPFANVGRLTEAGHQFIPYFDQDFLHHATVAAELARGLPPQNPYFAGERLHYYWFYHLWPAAVSALTDVTARDAVILTVPINVALFVLGLGLVLRQRIAALRPTFLALALGLFAYSYIGVLFVLRAAAEHDPMLARITSRLSDYSLISHSWFRDFLYEPQALTALCGVTLLLYMARCWSARPTPKGGALIALVLGTIVATDATIGVIALGWWSLVTIREWSGSPTSRSSLLVCTGLLAGVLAAVVWLGILPIGSGAMRIALHPMALWGPVYLSVDVGPMFPFAIVGLFAAVKDRRARSDEHLLLLGGVCLLVGFALFAPTSPNLAIRKSLKVLQIPLVAFSASAFAFWSERCHRRSLWALGITAVVPAVLTLATDTLQYVGAVRNSEHPPTYVSRDEMQVLEWIRTNTSRDAVFQSLDEVRPGGKFNDTYRCLIAAIGERRTLFGEYEKPYTLQVASAKVEARQGLLERMFTAADAGELRAVLDATGLDYLYVNEKKPGPTPVVRDLEALGPLIRVHCSGTVCVYRLNQAMTAKTQSRLPRHPGNGLGSIRIRGESGL
jgi:hypothetical protein